MQAGNSRGSNVEEGGDEIGRITRLRKAAGEEEEGEEERGKIRNENGNARRTRESRSAFN